DGVKQDYCTPDGTEDRGDNEVSDVGCTDEERQGKGEVIAGRVDIPMKQEEGEEEEEAEEEDEDDKERGQKVGLRSCPCDPVM
ncbi:unnamed protein product, partial [Ectocarpus fasciculatus]